MLVFQFHNIHNMTPNHENRVLELIALLRTTRDVFADIRPEQITSSQANVHNPFDEIAMSFRQPDNASLPKVVAHDDELKKKVSFRFK